MVSLSESYHYLCKAPFNREDLKLAHAKSKGRPYNDTSSHST